MSTTDRAGQIATLGDTLKPLGTKARGQPLTAGDWNLLVAAVAAMLRIDKDQDDDVAGRLAQNFAPAVHEHLGQVSVAWLDADLQSRVGGGGDGIATRQVLADMKQALAGVQAEVARLTALVDAQQGVVDRAAAGDTDRTRQLAAIDQRFAGIEDLRTTVTAVAQGQSALAGGVKSVLDFRGKLTDPTTGTLLDVGKLAAQVNDLQGLRDSMTGVDGKPLRLKDLQLDVIKLRDTVPASAGGGLDGRLAGLETDLHTRLGGETKAMVDALRGELDATTKANAAGLDERLKAGFDAGRAGAIDAARTEVAVAEQRLNAGVEAKLGDARSALAASLQQSVGDLVGTQLAGLDGRIASAVDVRASAVKAQVTADLQATLAGGLAAAETRLGGRVDTLQASVAATRDAIPAQVNSGIAAATAQLQSRADGRLEEQTKALRDTIGTLIDQGVKAGVEARIGDVRAVAVQAVSDNLRDLDARIATSVGTATRGIGDTVGAAVDAKLAQANLAGQIAAASGTLAKTLRDEIASSAAKVQATSSAALNSAVTNLRGELSSTRIATPATNERVVTGTITGGTIASERLRPG